MAVVVLPVLLAILLRGCLSGDPEPAQQAAAPALPPECAGNDAAAVRSRLGARIIVRMEGEATRPLLRQARAGEIGGVILFPPEGQDPEALAGEIERLQAAASDGGHGPLVVAIDQEGGEVKRLPELPPDVPPSEIGGDAAEAERQGLATGRALAALGVNVDLAPVLDVPTGPESFIASRAFATSVKRVAESGTAFAEGLEQGGVAATGKHFPGLGNSTGNTDLGPAEAGAGDPIELLDSLRPFRDAIAAGLDLVMLSNAVHPASDPRRPAFASPEVEELLRERIGFTGVTITDDLGAGAVTATYDAEAAALAAVRGGADLLLFALTSEPDVLEGLVKAAERGRIDAASVEASCVRLAILSGS